MAFAEVGHTVQLNSLSKKKKKYTTYKILSFSFHSPIKGPKTHVNVYNFEWKKLTTLPPPKWRNQIQEMFQELPLLLVIITLYLKSNKDFFIRKQSCPVFDEYPGGYQWVVSRNPFVLHQRLFWQGFSGLT